MRRSTRALLLHSGLSERKIARDRRPLVLAYHGVIDSAPHPLLDRFSVTTRTFRQHLARLGRIVDFGGVDDLLRPPAHGRPRALVTFDDGFETVHAHARGILREMGVPALVCVTAGLVDTLSTIWSLDIDLIITFGGLSAVQITAPDGTRQRRPLGSQAERESARLHARQARESGGDSPLHMAADLKAQLGPNRFLELIDTWRQFKIMTSTQVSDLAHDGFDIGVHGLNHLNLNTLEGPLIEREVVGARDVLRAKFDDIPLGTFCLPYGAGSAAALGAIRRAGFKLCLTTAPGRINDDPWLLPRFDGAAETSDLVGAIAAASDPRATVLELRGDRVFPGRGSR